MRMILWRLRGRFGIGRRCRYLVYEMRCRTHAYKRKCLTAGKGFLFAVVSHEDRVSFGGMIGSIARRCQLNSRAQRSTSASISNYSTLQSIACH